MWKLLLLRCFINRVDRKHFAFFEIFSTVVPGRDGGRGEEVVKDEQRTNTGRGGRG